jgi:hypothetical protein
MARPPLPIGTYGNIQTHKVAGGYRAFARFRDHDGVTRKVERNGPTEAAAKNRLRTHLRDRAQQNSRDGLHGESKLQVAADEWIASMDRLVMQGLRSPNTAQLYRLNLNTHVLPALGALRLREITVPRLDISRGRSCRDRWAGRFARAHSRRTRLEISDVLRPHRGGHPEHSASRNGRSGSRASTQTPRPSGRTSPVSASGCSGPAYGLARPWR